MWIFIALAVWCTLAIGLALVIGKAVRNADAAEQPKQMWLEDNTIGETLSEK